MKVLVVGSGGREHAIAWKLLQSPTVEQCFCLPGNGGTAILKGCENVEVKLDNFLGITEVCQQQHIDLVVVGPEFPLTLGITDHLQRHNIAVFGPTKTGSQLESSKSWAKNLMQEAGIPIAQGETFTEIEAAKDYARQQGAPIVVKADGFYTGPQLVV